MKVDFKAHTEEKPELTSARFELRLHTSDVNLLDITFSSLKVRRVDYPISTAFERNEITTIASDVPSTSAVQPGVDVYLGRSLNILITL